MLVKQFLRFSGVGAIGTTGHYITLVLLVEAADIDAVPASLAGFVVGALINYQLNRSYTFRSTVSHSIAIPKFLTIAVTGALLNTLIMSLAINQIKIHYFLSQILATCIVLIWGFMGNRLWTFNGAGKEHG